MLFCTKITGGCITDTAVRNKRSTPCTESHTSVALSPGVKLWAEAALGDEKKTCTALCDNGDLEI